MSDTLLISELIKKLQDVQKELGDLPVYTYDGPINLSYSGSRDGVIPDMNEKVNEIVIDLR